jgi:hypothetical protein
VRLTPLMRDRRRFAARSHIAPGILRSLNIVRSRGRPTARMFTASKDYAVALCRIS